MDWYLISVIAFVLVLAGLFYRDRRNVKRESILFVRKTSVGRKFLTKLGRRFPRLWWLYGTAAVVVGFAVSAYMIVWLMLFVGESLTTAQAVSSEPEHEHSLGPGIHRRAVLVLDNQPFRARPGT